ncbi:lipid-A-disaccharide synthase [Bermanella marisrubri]|uniref:Lipid-A-disaccharide synthase n=1 Tax=Bermanella marisrubri TaxID=207949 RepID=Q1N1W1_9GAMM|nr:lipid-A-disaccharide synthase [Bermanella marisrubri]EAT12170.1 lipid-A-disaccharide synthase [Oceanobacter sp. RED65] [Bermanella marisrubri]QIZ83645.1 lipid-A-disaccharide synthase [Bermanella marisrubri]
MALCFAMVAGEASGDILGAGLIQSLKKRYPDARFVGIGGPKMEAQGFESLYPMERLSVMGLVEVLGRLPELLGIRKKLYKTFLEIQPDAFIGIDAPDFNLTLERMLKDKGITAIHYVSPSVWAWREKRVKKIRESVDQVLCLFPFEVDFYSKHNVPATFVGHTLADAIDLEPDTHAARELLELDQDRPVVALLPGSRQGEVSRLGELFLQTAELVRRHKPDVQFVIPAANKERKQQLQELLAPFENLRVKLVLGQSTDVMTAADTVLMASGTAALEGMLLKKPLVVSYKLSSLTAFIVRRLLTQPYVSLPNLLAKKQLVPEILQEQATPENLAEAVLTYVQDPTAAQKLKDKFMEMHLSLRLDADEAAADAVLQTIKARAS